MSVLGAEFPGELAQFTFISCDEETIDIQNFSIKFKEHFCFNYLFVNDWKLFELSRT